MTSYIQKMVSAKMDLSLPVFPFSYNACVCRICHRHEENAHNRWGAVSFLCTLFRSLSLAASRSLLRLSRSFSWVKENHVLICIDYYQSQTPCKQTGQAGAALLCEHKPESEKQRLGNLAGTQCTDIKCVSRLLVCILGLRQWLIASTVW